MNGAIVWIKSDALAAKATRTFVYTFVGVILYNWYAASGPDQRHISGLVDCVKTQWDAAGATALIAVLGTLGITGFLQKTP